MRTITQTETSRVLVLKLRKPQKKVTFTKETVDNEHLNRKKSKVCCIYHSNSGCATKNKYEGG